MTTFMVEYNAGRASVEDLDDWIEQWHNAPTGSDAAAVDMHDWLGMTWEQYVGWIMRRDFPGMRAT